MGVVDPRAALSEEKASAKVDGKVAPVLVIHGGAGTMMREGSTPEKRKAFRMALAKALEAVSFPYHLKRRASEWRADVELSWFYRATPFCGKEERRWMPLWQL